MLLTQPTQLAAPCDEAGAGNAPDAHREPTSDQHAQPGVTVRCVECHTRLRWTRRAAGRARCPHCGTQLVLRRAADDRWCVQRENEDSVAGLVCDWLGDRCPDEEREV